MPDACRSDPVQYAAFMTEYAGGHGHIDDYDDNNNNGVWDVGEESSWGYWTLGGYAEVRGDAPDTGCGEGNVGNGNGNGDGNGGGGDGNGDGNGGGGNNPQFSIVVIRGPGSGAPGDTLTFVVEVQKDGIADTNQDQGVTFSVSPSDGNITLGTTNVTADSNGRAQTTLELGNSASDSYTITVTLDSNTNVSVTGTATVTTGGNKGGNNENSEKNNGGNNGNNGNNGGNSGNNEGNNGNNDGGNNQQRDIRQRSDSESDQDRRYAFQLNLYAGWNFVHVPLEVTQVDGESMSIETVGDLFQILMPANMYIHDGSCWVAVFGDSTQELGANQGIVVYMDAPLTVNLVGLPLPINFVIQRGLTFVGLPRQPPTSLRKISDFFTLYPNVCAVLVASKGQLYLVGRAGDSRDVSITGGQAFAFIAIEQYMINFTGAAWGKVLPE